MTRQEGIRIFNRYDPIFDKPLEIVSVDKISVLNRLRELQRYRKSKSEPDGSLNTLIGVFQDEMLWLNIQNKLQFSYGEMDKALKGFAYVLQNDSGQTDESGVDNVEPIKSIVSHPNIWIILSRLDLGAPLSDGQEFIDALKDKGMRVIEFLSWADGESLAADLLTRDIDWFHREHYIIERIREMGYTSALSHFIRQAVYDESLQIGQKIHNCAEKVGPIIFDQIKKRIGTFERTNSTDLGLLDRIQIVSLERGGRLLTYGLLTAEPFKRLLFLHPSTAYRSVKIDTEEISKQTNPIDAYSFQHFERIRKIVEGEPKRDIILLIDLYGGVRREQKQEAVHSLFAKLSNHPYHIFTVGESEYNDISVPISEIHLLDMISDGKALGKSTIVGNYFVNISPPFPWTDALHTNGKERLRSFLKI